MVRDRYPPRPARRSVKAVGVAATLYLLAAAGCAPVDGNAPLLTSPTLTPVAGGNAERLEYRIASENGETIALTEWRPEGTAEAVVLAVHGYGDYGPSTFDGAARGWAERGIVTYAYDQRGFGRNESNGDWPGHGALIADLGEIARLIRARHPGLPLIVIGHSMGGAVVTAALGEGLVEADKAVLLAPALWGGKNLNPFLRFMALSAASFSPDKRWSGDGIVTIQASDNIEMLRALGRDPLYVSPPSSREFVGLIRVMDRADEAAERVSTPVLVIYGDKDQVIPEGPVRETFDRIPAEKRFQRVDSGWHMLLRDLEGQKVRDMIAEYVLTGV